MDESPLISNPTKLQTLLIEDHIIAQKIGALVLEELNCAVDVTGSGTEALAMMKHKSYDVAFIDLGLPDMDGFELLAALNPAIFPNRPAKIVVLTAHTDLGYFTRCLTLGADDCLTKPLTLENSSHFLTAVSISN